MFILPLIVGLAISIIVFARRLGETYQPYVIFMAAIVLATGGLVWHSIASNEEPSLWSVFFLFGLVAAGVWFILRYTSQDMMTFAFLLRDKSRYLPLLASFTAANPSLDRDCANRLASGIREEDIEDAYFRSFSLGIGGSAFSAAKALDEEHQMLMSAFPDDFRLPQGSAPSGHCMVSLCVPVDRWVVKRLGFLEHVIPYSALNAILRSKMAGFGDMFVSYLPSKEEADYWEYQKILDRFRSFDYQFKI